MNSYIKKNLAIQKVVKGLEIKIIYVNNKIIVC